MRARLLPIALMSVSALVILTAAASFVFSRTDASQGGVGGPFRLESQDGKPVTQAALDGHPTLVFFGYTHCPDVCPATLGQLSSIFKQLGPQAEARALFITVDPQRDTPAVLKEYLANFDPRITALTGTPEAIHKVESEYKAYAKAVPDDSGGYSMDHTAITYLMDKHGKFVGAFNTDRPVAEAASELKSYN